jgi:hypothetical protein
MPAADDPKPQPPDRPEPGDCCGSGCVVCVFDYYEEQLERYEKALSEWRLRHPEQLNATGLSTASDEEFQNQVT